MHDINLHMAKTQKNISTWSYVILVSTQIMNLVLNYTLLTWRSQNYLSTTTIWLWSLSWCQQVCFMEFLLSSLASSYFIAYEQYTCYHSPLISHFKQHHCTLEQTVESLTNPQALNTLSFSWKLVKSNNQKPKNCSLLEPSGAKGP